jgi:hypothetical protein
MAKDETKRKKPPPFTLASLYLAVGLAVCFIVLTKMVPAMSGIVDEKVKTRQSADGGWHAVTLQLSAWACSHQSVLVTAFTVVAIGGFILPFVIRPTRYLIWAAALAVFLLDVALAAGGWWNTVGGLLKEANELSR